MSEKQIEIPLHVITDLEEIRTSGKYNMMDSNSVLNELNNTNKYSSVVWLAEIRNSGSVAVNRNRYLAALKELGEVRYLADKLSES